MKKSILFWLLIKGQIKANAFFLFAIKDLDLLRVEMDDLTLRKEL